MGGGDIYVSEFHTPSWGMEHIKALLPLLKYQSYINHAQPVQFEDHVMTEWRTGHGKPSWIRDNITHDLHQAEADRNPKEFPEWDRRVWPGNIHIAKRYAVHFNVPWDIESQWLEAPTNDHPYDIVFHAPVRRLVRDRETWRQILTDLAAKHRLLILGGMNDIDEWYVAGADKLVPPSFLETAGHINSAKLFLGAASSCNVIAEALKKTRLVELAPDCFNTHPTICINDWSASEIIDRVGGYFD